MTQLDVLHKIIEYIKQNGTNDWKKSLDNSIKDIGYANYTNLEDVVNEMIDKLSKSSSSTAFLKTACNIDFTNSDCGSILGIDAGGTTSIDEHAVVNESKYPTITINETSVTSIWNGSGGFFTRISYGNVSSVNNGLFFASCLCKWFAASSNIMWQVFGESTNNPALDFQTEYAPSGDYFEFIPEYDNSNNEFAKLQKFVVYEDYVSNLDKSSEEGITVSDKTVLGDLRFIHELCKAFQRAIIPYSSLYPDWFTEGIATVVEAGDNRKQKMLSILDNLQNHSDIMTLYTKLNQVDKETAEALGFIFFRYILKEVVDDGSATIPPSPSLPKQRSGSFKFSDENDKLVETGNVKTLFELASNFLIFAQAPGKNIQAWELIDERLSTFYGATLKVPLLKWKDYNTKTRAVTDTENMPYFYISLQHTNVTGNTYQNYIYSSPFTKQEFVYGTGQYHNGNMSRSSHYIGISGCPSAIYGKRITSLICGGRYDIYSPYGSNGYPNFFSDTGEFVAISPHTLYDENLWMCEQGGNSCIDITENRDGSLINLISGQMTTWTVNGTATDGFIRHPLFPGTGTPWLTLSNANISTYNVGSYGIDYWFTKTDYNATITFRLNGGVVNPDVYQSISFGMMNGVNEVSYMFPLYVCGGNEGLINLLTRHSFARASCPTYTTGNVYSLSVDSIAMSNSNMLHPTRFNNSSITNFKILSPQGIWKYITTHTQNASVIQYYRCNASSCGGNEWGYPLQDVADDLATNFNVMFPNTGRNARFKIDTYVVNKQHNKFENSSPLQHVLVFVNKATDYGETGCMGIIDNVYSGWYRSLPCGEVKIQGKKYLSVPNAWDGRMWFYPYHIGEIVNTEWSPAVIKARYEDRNNIYKSYQIRDRLLIPLEEGA